MRALLNVDEAAEQLQCGRTSIYKFSQTGKLGHVKIGRSLRFTHQHLEDFILKNSTEATRPHNIRTKLNKLANLTS